MHNATQTTTPAFDAMQCYAVGFYYIYLTFKNNYMTDLINEMTQRMMSEIQEKREAFIKEMLTKKGYEHLIPTEKMRFPKINRSIAFDGWEYIFVDNESKQGDFIVAIGPWEPDTKFDLSNLSEMSASCQTTYSFKWQDKNFDAVRLP